MIDGFTRVLQTSSDLRVLLGLVRGAPCSSCLHPLRRAVLLPGRRTDRGPELTTPLDVEGRSEFWTAIRAAAGKENSPAKWM